ncbi:MAG: nucleotidyltransferase domain-containing protein, partial [Bacteroidetes bacterium]|nr:nucleotidyltransferase domain-containing protein [Bacteroidota bacterium]
MQTEAVNIIKEEIKKRGIDVKKIILFGSRARNAYKKDS